MAGPLTGLFSVLLGIMVAVAVGLRCRPRFAARPLLNRSEIKLRSAIARMLPKGVLLMAQVSYSEMLANKSRSRYLTVNAKRADMVICDYDFNPLAVIEYQGAGHNGSSWRSLIDTRRRDRQKRVALKEAGIPLIEVPARYRLEELRDMVQDALGLTKGAA